MNVVTDPTNNFNSCDDFLGLVTTCQILTASLHTLGMQSLRDTPSHPMLPSTDEVLAETPERRKKILQNVCGKIVDCFIQFQFNESAVNRQSDGIYEYTM